MTLLMRQPGRSTVVFVNYLVHGKCRSTDVDYTKNFEVLASDNKNIKVCFNESKLAAWIADCLRLLPIRLRHFPFLEKKLNPFLKKLGQYTILFPWQLKGVDVVLTHWYYPVFIGNKKIPIVYSAGFHGNQYAGFNNDEERKKSGNFLEVRRKIDHAAISFFPAKNWITHFSSLAGSRYENKIEYVPHLLPLASKRKVFPAKKFSTQQIRILFVGRDGKRKGLPNLIKAIQRILKKYPALRTYLQVDIVSEYSVDMVSENIPGTHHPALSKLEVIQLMEQAHIYCMPTQQESYGHVFIEAMGSCCAIIADRQATRSEIFNHGKLGQLIAPDSITELEEALTKYIFNRNLMVSHAMSCFKKFNSEYAFEVVRDRLQELVLEVAYLHPNDQSAFYSIKL